MQTLLSTNWWGCGSATLIDMKALLARLDGPRAQALLRVPIEPPPWRLEA